jgi:hypothetical protein
VQSKARHGADAVNRVGIDGTAKSRQGVTLGTAEATLLGSHSRVLYDESVHIADH